MKQRDLDRAVARATGESVTLIRHLGFGLVDELDVLRPDPDCNKPQVIDWDDFELQRNTRSIWRSHDALAIV